jgi:hypothetical protein
MKTPKQIADEILENHIKNSDPNLPHIWYSGRQSDLSQEIANALEAAMNAKMPSSDEIKQEIAKLYFKDPESSRAKAFELGVKWLQERMGR